MVARPGEPSPHGSHAVDGVPVFESCRDAGDRVLRQQPVPRNQCHRFDLSLRDEHAVKRILVNRRQRAQGAGMGNRKRQFPEIAGSHFVFSARGAIVANDSRN